LLSLNWKEERKEKSKGGREGETEGGRKRKKLERKEERKGGREERKGKERKRKERKGKERKGKKRKGLLCRMTVRSKYCHLSQDVF
jgi:septum formation inhibitor MinC